MEIFINEVSLEGQYFADEDFTNAIKEFKRIFEIINEKIRNKKIYKEDSSLFINYEAIKGSNFQQSLNSIRDKSLKIALKNIIFNKLSPKEWRKEQVHSSTDFFDYLTSEICRNVNNTSLAEAAERKLQNTETNYLLINFKNSGFKIAHPCINYCCLVTIIKNNDETKPIDLDGIDNQFALESWLEQKLNLSKTEYNDLSSIPPSDEQTILRENSRFQKTSFRYDGRVIYCEVVIGRYWYVDNLHYGKAAHLEVFDRTGCHIGEADLQGNIDESKRDKEKKINLS
jgi:hypothetical protein